MPARIVEITDSDEEELTVDHFHQRPSKFAYLLTLLTSVGGFLIGYDAGVISGGIILLKEDFGMTYVWQSLMVSSTVAAAGIFALIAKRFFNERFGRKPVILCSSFVFALGSVLTAVASNLTVLLAGRIVVGIAIGLLSTTSPLYIAELATTASRGRLVTINMVLIAGGQFTGSCVDGIFAVNSANALSRWRYMIGLGAVPSALQFMGFIFMPESPVWLIAQGHYESAKSALLRLRKPGADVEDEVNLLKLSLEDKNHPESKSSRVRDLLSQPAVRRAVLIGCGLHMCQQFIGINTIMYYSATIIQMTGTKDKSSIIWMAAGISAINLLGSFIGLYLMEKVGRRPLALLSLFGVLIGLIVLAISFQLIASNSPAVTYTEELPETINGECQSNTNCQMCIESVSCGFCYKSTDTSATSEESCVLVADNDYSHAKYGRCVNTTAAANAEIYWSYDSCLTSYTWVPVFGLVLYLFFFAPGMGPLPWTICSEIYPTAARSLGTAAAATTSWFCSFLVSSSFLFLVEGLHKYGVFWLYSGVTVFAMTFVYFIVPETRDKKAEELQALFAPNKTLTDDALRALPTEKPVQFVRIRGLNRDGQESLDDDDSDSE